MSTCIVCGSVLTVEDGTRGARCDLHATGRRVDSDPVAAAEAAYSDACVAFHEGLSLDTPTDLWNRLNAANLGRWSAAGEAHRALQQARQQARQQAAASQLDEQILWIMLAAMSRSNVDFHKETARNILAALRQAGFRISRDAP